ncbi:MAG: hypothetical protein VB031_05640 [Eubacteriaceae bacterium]|nr:hypothetical protein [Eubacteriaceae bacterium]
MKYPKYIITGDGHIGTFNHVDPGIIPIYRFDGGDRMACENEMIKGTDSREEIEAKSRVIMKARRNHEHRQ